MLQVIILDHLEVILQEGQLLSPYTPLKLPNSFQPPLAFLSIVLFEFLTFKSLFILSD